MLDGWDAYSSSLYALQLIVEVVKTYLQHVFLMLCVCVLQEWALEKKRLTDANAQALEKASTAQLGDTVQIQ